MPEAPKREFRSGLGDYKGLVVKGVMMPAVKYDYCYKLEVYSALIKSLLLVSLVSLLTSCQPADKTRNHTSSCPERPDTVYFYVNNRSFTDTLALARITIDDSVYLAKKIALNRSSDSRLYQVLTLCPGPHQVSATFGRYQADTTFVLQETVSLGVSMEYNPKFPPDFNGVTIWLLKRDGRSSSK